MHNNLWPRQVSEPYVLRVLINSANIERTVLAADRKVGDDTLKSLVGGGVAWTADHMRVTRYAYVLSGLFILSMIHDN